jgi:UDP-glucose 4-epimerase
MRLLVTGGAGFIGSHIADRALAEGWDVAIVDDLSTGHRENMPERAEFFQVDIRDAEGVLQAFESFRPTAVSHQAAQASVSISVARPVFDTEVNVIGSLNVIDACVKCDVGRLVFASTGGAIYGEVPEGTRASEATAPSPMSPYAVSKLAVEHHLAAAQFERGLDYRVLRYGNVYGPRQDPHGEAGVVAIFLNRLVAGDGIQINARREAGDEGCIRDYVFVDNVASANIAAVANGHLPKVMNVASGVATSTRELANELARTLQVTPEMTCGARRQGDLERSVLDPRLFVKNVEPVVALGNGLRRLCNAVRPVNS